MGLELKGAHVSCLQVVWDMRGKDACYAGGTGKSEVVGLMLYSKEFLSESAVVVQSLCRWFTWPDE